MMWGPRTIWRLGHPPVIRAAIAILLVAQGSVGEAQQIPRSPGTPYSARTLPDRIILTPGADPTREMAVAYRVDTLQPTAEGQIAIATDGPVQQEIAVTINGTTQSLETVNGHAYYHHLRFVGLKPDTAYVYRVRGSAGWSEWHHFRTAAEGFRPFRFLYLGDVQNGILQEGARVVRQAFHAGGPLALVVHAGDLVSASGDLDIDDGWGEWAQAGGHNFAMIPQLPAVGNHEYDSNRTGNGPAFYRLGKHWSAQFALPGNGSTGSRSTTYHVDYQGVRFIMLDATSALNLGTASEQASWLERSLKTTALWKVVVFHQPLFSCARSSDNEPLIAAWQQVLERYGADLVLQGHDHCFSRISGDGKRGGTAMKRPSVSQPGPVYVVSVAGKKMNPLNDTSIARTDKSAEAIQLFQLIDVDEDRLSFRAITATGRILDSFALVRSENGAKILHENTVTWTEK